MELDRARALLNRDAHLWFTSGFAKTRRTPAIHFELCYNPSLGRHGLTYLYHPSFYSLQSLAYLTDAFSSIPQSLLPLWGRLQPITVAFVQLQQLHVPTTPEMASEQNDGTLRGPAINMQGEKKHDDTYQEQSTAKTVLLISSALLSMFLVALDRTIISTVRRTHIHPVAETILNLL
jgi:hypothetical protein